jgi:hypothetical protein
MVNMVASPLQFTDDVEFWFPPGNRSIVEYRSASRLGESDGDINRKRIRVSFACFFSLFSHVENWLQSIDDLRTKPLLNSRALSAEAFAFL